MLKSDRFGEEWQRYDPEVEARILIRQVFPLSLALAERDCEIGARVVSKRSNKRLMQILLREEKDHDKSQDAAGFHSVLLHMMELCLASEYFPYPFSFPSIAPSPSHALNTLMHCFNFLMVHPLFFCIFLVWFFSHISRHASQGSNVVEGCSDAGA
jgi:hypothetical protein